MIALLAVAAWGTSPDVTPECAPILRDLRSEWLGASTSESGATHLRAFLALWPTVPENCRGGTWYLVGAQAIARGQRPDGAPSTERETLDLGLTAEPGHPALLAFVAFGAPIDPGAFPPLPTDACERLAATPGDDASYVCACAALAAGRWDESAAWFAKIGDLAAFPGAAEREATALRATGRRAAARPEKDAELRCLRFGATIAQCGR